MRGDHLSGTDLLGEFEHLVLLSILQNDGEGYAILLRRTLERVTERSVSRGALYRTLERLVGKGLVSWDLEDPSPDRGGNPRKRFRVLPDGLEALRRSRAVVSKISAGLEELLEQPS